MLGPEAMEAAAFRRRHIARCRPACGHWHRAKPSAIAASPPERTARELDKRMIESRPARHPGPQSQADAIYWRVQPLGELPPPPMPPQRRPRDLDRRHLLAM